MKKNSDPQWVNDTKRKIREKIEKHGSVEAAVEADFQNIVKCDHIVGYLIHYASDGEPIQEAIYLSDYYGFESKKVTIPVKLNHCDICGEKLNLK